MVPLARLAAHTQRLVPRPSNVCSILMRPTIWQPRCLVDPALTTTLLVESFDFGGHRHVSMCQKIRKCPQAATSIDTSAEKRSAISFVFAVAGAQVQGNPNEPLYPIYIYVYFIAWTSWHPLGTHFEEELLALAYFLMGGLVGIQKKPPGEPQILHAAFVGTRHTRPQSNFQIK